MSDQQHESTPAVVAAILGNLAIAVVKFAATAITGSSAMLTEGIHSVVDTGNGCLLLLGIRRSKRPATSKHPFGYGKELYFWSLVVAGSVFGVGGGVSIYEGILRIRDPVPLSDPILNYIVLAVSMVFESISFSIAYRQFRRSKGSLGTFAAIHHGKDPSMFTVVFEDSAALAGLAIAFLGIFFGHLLDAPRLDGAASLGIGLLLAAAAFWLAIETKGLLIGERATPDVVEALEQIASEDPTVVRVGHALTMHLGPNEILLNLGLEFVPRTTAEEIHGAIHRIEDRIGERFPEVTRIYLEVESFR